MKRIKQLIQLAVILLFIGNSAVSAQNLKPANIFCDHMVLQRGKTIPIWGEASSNKKVKINFNGQSKSTRADSDGKWIIHLDAMEASSIGKDMVIISQEKVIIKDILIGEVWLCSGQSNMFWPANNITDIKRMKPLVKNVRSFYVQNLVAFEEQDQVHGQWKVEPPVSAVAFSFAYFLSNLGDVPVGIIQAAWGSSSLEAWMSRDLTSELPHFDSIMTEFDADIQKKQKIEDLINKKEWTRNENIYLRRQPNILYNAMIHPLIPYSISGILWYQGERNAGRMSGMAALNGDNSHQRVCGIKEYDTALQKWIQNYRNQWDDDIHLMVVMLPGFGKGTSEKKEIDPESPTEPSWAWMRESQMNTLSLPNVSVVNTIDLGELKNIHPKDKLPVGQRAALLAAKNTLKEDVYALGPTVKKVEINSGKLIVHFDNAIGLKTTNNKAPTAFWITDDSKEWVRADAKIKGESVILSSKKVQEPKYIRYAFSGKPMVNLVNKFELPAYPFRTDNWDE